MSWSVGKISDIADVISGYAFKSSWFGAGSSKVVRIGDLQNGIVNIDAAQSFDEMQHPIKEQFIIRQGDILMALSGATVGKIALASKEVQGAYLNQRVAIIRGKCPDSGSYLKYVFSGPFQKRLLLSAGGAAQPNLSPKDLSNMEIPLPPLNEQKRIAAILDKADAIRHKRQQAIQLADDLLRSIFLDMFGDPVTNPKGWEEKSIKDVAKVTTGNTPSRKAPEYYGGKMEWVKSDNINTPEHTLTKAIEFLSEEGVKIARTAPKGSTLITCIAGSFDCIGNAAFADREVAFNQQINALTPKKCVLDWFLYALVLFSKKAIQKASTNSMKGMVSKGKLEEVKLIAPPIEQQQKFEKIFNQQIKTVLRLRESASDANNIFNSLSQKAFAGQL